MILFFKITSYSDSSYCCKARCLRFIWDKAFVDSRHFLKPEWDTWWAINLSFPLWRYVFSGLVGNNVQTQADVQCFQKELYLSFKEKSDRKVEMVSKSNQ